MLFFSRPYLDKAQIEINAGNFLSALENCSKAIEIDENCLDAYYSRAIIYNRIDKYRLAISDLSHVLNHNPLYQYAYTLCPHGYAIIINEQMLALVRRDFRIPSECIIRIF